MKIHREEFILPGHAGKEILADIHYPVDRQQCRLIIYAHGINGFKDWGGMNLIAEAFAKAGHAFVKFNFSHNGCTTQHPTEFKDLEAYGNDNYSIRQQELNLLTRYLLKPQLFPFRVKGLTLLGHSRGGTDVILNMAHHSPADQLITWAAPAEAKTPWRQWEAEKMRQWKKEGVIHLENKRTEQKLPLYYQLYEDYQQNRSYFKLETAAAKIDRPWLICHGDEDEAVFVKDAYDLKSWQPKANIKILHHTGHTFGRSHPWTATELPEASQELVEHSLDFIESYQ